MEDCSPPLTALLPHHTLRVGLLPFILLPHFHLLLTLPLMDPVVLTIRYGTDQTSPQNRSVKDPQQSTNLSANNWLVCLRSGRLIMPISSRILLSDFH